MSWLCDHLKTCRLWYLPPQSIMILTVERLQLHQCRQRLLHVPEGHEIDESREDEGRDKDMQKDTHTHWVRVTMRTHIICFFRRIFVLIIIHEQAPFGWVPPATKHQTQRADQNIIRSTQDSSTQHRLESSVTSEQWWSAESIALPVALEEA